MTTLNIRIDEQLKKKSSKTLAALGLDMSSAVKLFLNQVVTEQGLPFKPKRTLAQIKKQWDKEVVEALKGKGYSSVKEMHDDILKGL
jgi:DNA-damage-inducible protein J